MANLYEILAEAQNGEALTEIGRAYGLTQQQTEAAVAALLPAISMGLKRSTDTPEGLGNLLALMAQRPDLYAFYDDPRVAFSPEGFAAGNAALSQMFGSPEASRAIAAQAQNLSGVTSAILKKLLAGDRRHDHFRPDAQRIGTGCAASAATGAGPCTGPRRRIDRHPAPDLPTGRTRRGRSNRSRLGVDSLGHPSHRRHSRRT